VRMYALKSVEAAEFEIKEDEESLVVPAVITREGVYEYGDMLTYEPAEILEKAAYAAR